MSLDPAAPNGEGEWQGVTPQWLPAVADTVYVCSLIVSCTRSGEMASWIAPHARGIDSKPLENECARP